MTAARDSLSDFAGTLKHIAAAVSKYTPVATQEIDLAWKHIATAVGHLQVGISERKSKTGG